MDRITRTTGAFRTAEAPAPAGTTAVAAPETPAAAPEVARVAGQAESPYASLGAAAARVRVDRWGQGPNSSLEGILRRQGYSREEIYGRDASGRTLAQRVAAVNDLKDPNLVHPGQDLTVPVKPREGAPAPQDPQAGSPRPQDELPGVRVDGWGQGPNSSLDRILRNQGYRPEEIYRRDRDGRTLVDRVAAQNGLKRPEDLKAGSTLRLPARGPVAGTPENPPQAQVAGTPENRPQTPAPENGEAREGVTLEMGMLLDGAREGRFTRQEFQGLNSAANRYEELRAAYGKDGFTQRELATLGQHERAYGQMFARFHQDDRARVEFTVSGNPEDPQVRRRVEMNEAGGRLFDRFTAGELPMEEALEQLRLQRLGSRALGQAN